MNQHFRDLQISNAQKCAFEQSRIQTLFCIGANHSTANIALRERLFIDDAMIGDVLSDFCESTSCDEALVLSTCNRLELVGVISGSWDMNLAYRLFYNLQLKSHPGRKAADSKLDLDSLKQAVYCYTGDQAIEHVISVASGLDSLVLGETQITGQFKRAVNLSRDKGALGQVLEKLCQDALNTNGRIRTQTAINRGKVSISSSAVDLAMRVCGSLSNLQVLIIGAGEMGSLAARYATDQKPQSLMILNRTQQKAIALANELGCTQTFSDEELGISLQLADVVISASSQKSEIIDWESLERIQHARQFRPLYIIDIGMPRNFPATSSQIENIYLFDIDDLKQVVAANLEDRRLAAAKAKDLVQSSTAQFSRWYKNRDIGPVLERFRFYLDDLLEREWQRTLKREAFGSLTDEQKLGLLSMFKSVATKISSDAGSRIMRAQDEGAPEVLAAALNKLFALRQDPRPDGNES